MESSLTDYARLSNELKQLPRNQLWKFCRENGFHSWHNAKADPNYSKWSGQAR